MTAVTVKDHLFISTHSPEQADSSSLTVQLPCYRGYDHSNSYSKEQNSHRQKNSQFLPMGLYTFPIALHLILDGVSFAATDLSKKLSGEFYTDDLDLIIELIESALDVTIIKK